MSKIIPIFRPGAAAMFVSALQILPRDVVLEGDTTVMTQPLKNGTRFDLLGLSQADHLIQAGLQDQTDSLDSEVSVNFLYLQLSSTVSDVHAAEVFQIPLNRAKPPTFKKAPGNSRKLVIDTDYRCTFKTDMATIYGNKSVILATLKDRFESFTFVVKILGSLFLDTSDTEVHISNPTFVNHKVKGTGDFSHDRRVVLSLELDATILGYDLDATRVNHNRCSRSSTWT